MLTPEAFLHELKTIITGGIREDIGSGDHSSLACIPAEAMGRARLLVKDTGVIAGVEFARMVLEAVDPELHMEVLIPDGTPVDHGDIVFTVQGRSRSILGAERLLLNSMQRMSAIATKTRHFADLLEGTKTKILDTRKTTPNFRAAEKWAVRIGGGENHRFALYDMVMLKDNHIDFSGGITGAIKKTQDYLAQNNLDLRIIVEARDLAEVSEILEAGGVYRILLDNFSFEMTREAVGMIGDRCLTESSGNINEKTIVEYARCGVDYISSGALTHSVHNMDLSLKAY